MKIGKLALALALLAVTLLLALSSCSEKKPNGEPSDSKGSQATEDSSDTSDTDPDDTDPEPHIHVYDRQTASEAYLMRAASCTERALYYCSCVCGEMGSETFPYGTPSPHVYDRETVSEAYLKSLASCTEGAFYYKSCVCGAKGEESFSHGSPLGHSYGTAWEKNETHHWHGAICGHDAETSERGKHIYGEDLECDVCGNLSPEAGIRFSTLETDGLCVFGKVSNATETFSFAQEIIVAGKVTFAVSSDAEGNVTLDCERVSLSVGDNVFYVRETVGETERLYTVTLRRRPTYTVTFDANGGSAVESQTVEEDGFAVAPSPSKLGCVLDGWTPELSLPITENVTLTAIWSATPEMQNYTFTSSDTVCTVTGVIDKTRSEYSLPDYVTAIGDYAFHACRSMVGVVIPSSVTEIGKSAFRECDALSEVYYGGTAEEWGSVSIGTINSCLTDATVYYYLAYSETAEIGKYWYSENGIVMTWEVRADAVVRPETVNPDLVFSFNEAEQTYTITGYTGSGRSIVIPTTYQGYAVTEIAADAFANCTTLRRVSYATGSNLRLVGEGAFRGCTSLTGLALPNTTVSIGASALEGCTALRLVRLGSSLESIGDGAFRGCVAVSNVYYAGDAKTRAEIAIGSDNDALAAATWHYNGSDNSGVDLPVIS